MGAFSLLPLWLVSSVVELRGLQEVHEKNFGVLFIVSGNAYYAKLYLGFRLFCTKINSFKSILYEFLKSLYIMPFAR